MSIACPGQQPSCLTVLEQWDAKAGEVQGTHNKGRTQGRQGGLPQLAPALTRIVSDLSASRKWLPSFCHWIILKEELEALFYSTSFFLKIHISKSQSRRSAETVNMRRRVKSPRSTHDAPFWLGLKRYFFSFVFFFFLIHLDSAGLRDGDVLNLFSTYPRSVNHKNEVQRLTA